MGLLSKCVELPLLFITFCCAAIVLGIYSYFLAVLADRDLPIRDQWKAVEGISGAACLWTLLQVPVMCCLGGKKFFSILLATFNIIFCAGFIALAVLTRHGANSCSGYVRTPLGSGPADRDSPGYGVNGFGFGTGENSTYAPNLHLACRLNTAAFAVSLIGAVFFALAAIMNIFIGRHERAENRYGPSPSNNYSSGSGGRFGPGVGSLAFWKRSQRNRDMRNGDALPAHPDPSMMQDEKRNDLGGNAYSSAGTNPVGGGAGTAYAQPAYGSTAPTAAYNAPYGAPVQQPGVSSHNAMLKSEGAPNPYQV